MRGRADGGSIAHLRRAGTSVVVHLDPRLLPCVLHWGPDLGDLPEAQSDDLLAALKTPYIDSEIYVQERVSLLPQHATGWLGRPGLLGSRAGQAWSVAFDRVTNAVEEAGTEAWPDGPEGAIRLRSVGTDEPGELEVTTELQLLAGGLLRVRASVRNLAETAYEVLHLEPALPVPAEADELLDMTGRHTRERSPQRRPFDHGQWVREAWGGRPGHDAATVMCAGRSGFGFRSGRVWGVHVAASGCQRLTAEHVPTGWRLLRGGELLLPGEVLLDRDGTYLSPWLYASWGEGLDEFSSRFHRYLRARPQHPSRPRPVLLNTWEAVYFDHNVSKLLLLAERAAELGIERFVLDDGWFRHRRDDRAGLGDWYVDEVTWPHGLTPLVERVRALGMEFGLWFEPEMVNLDSDLARAHPEWLFATNHGPGLPSRFQHVLDLGHREAYDFVLERMSSIIGEYDVEYLKWDHNRPLLDAGHQPTGVPGIREHTMAVHRMLRALKDRHPGLEIESCCGGGGRVDLGILELTDRVWVSDCIDAHERHRMVRWTGLTLPPELMGTHVGSSKDHSTKRTHALNFRAGTAIWGHLGVELDLTAVAGDDFARLASWIAFHKHWRWLLHSGDVVRADLANPVLQLEGVVSADRDEALYRLSALDHTLTWPPGRIPLPGLDPDRSYRVSLLPPANREGDAAPPGWTGSGVTLTGRLLAEVGVHSPLLDSDELVVIHARAE